MVLFESKLEYLFNEYNKKYFDGILPVPFFKVIHKKNTFGRFECVFGWRKITNPVIMVTDKYNFTEEQLRDIMVHEMIHYYLAYTKKDRIVRHGKEFKRMMNDFNLNEGFNIQITYDPKEFEIDKNKETIMEKVSNFLFG